MEPLDSFEESYCHLDDVPTLHPEVPVIDGANCMTGHLLGTKEALATDMVLGEVAMILFPAVAHVLVCSIWPRQHVEIPAGLVVQVWEAGA
jgi:hypothetical protein